VLLACDLSGRISTSVAGRGRGGNLRGDEPRDGIRQRTGADDEAAGRDFESHGEAVTWMAGGGEHIGVLSPHKKGSLVAEMLISATLPIEPMAQWAFFMG